MLLLLLRCSAKGGVMVDFCVSRVAFEPFILKKFEI